MLSEQKKQAVLPEDEYKTLEEIREVSLTHFHTQRRADDDASSAISL